MKSEKREESATTQESDDVTRWGKMALLAYRDKHILSAQQLRKLSEHKYSCFSVSLLDPLLQPWWNWLVAQTPLWLAPNLITIVGLILNVVTTLILIW